jgi:hypothetical protein
MRSNCGICGGLHLPYSPTGRTNRRVALIERTSFEQRKSPPAFDPAGLFSIVSLCCSLVEGLRIGQITAAAAC